eukprot:PhM_4_TR7804/c1_g1_i1/m.3498
MNTVATMGARAVVLECQTEAFHFTSCMLRTAAAASARVGSVDVAIATPETRLISKLLHAIETNLARRREANRPQKKVMSDDDGTTIIGADKRVPIVTSCNLEASPYKCGRLTLRSLVDHVVLSSSPGAASLVSMVVRQNLYECDLDLMLGHGAVGADATSWNCHYSQRNKKAAKTTTATERNSQNIQSVCESVVEFATSAGGLVVVGTVGASPDLVSAIVWSENVLPLFPHVVAVSASDDPILDAQRLLCSRLFGDKAPAAAPSTSLWRLFRDEHSGEVLQQLLAKDTHEWRGLLLVISDVIDAQHAQRVLQRLGNPHTRGATVVVVFSNEAAVSRADFMTDDDGANFLILHECDGGMGKDDDVDYGCLYLADRVALRALCVSMGLTEACGRVGVPVSALPRVWGCSQASACHQLDRLAALGWVRFSRRVHDGCVVVKIPMSKLEWLRAQFLNEDGDDSVVSAPRKDEILSQLLAQLLSTCVSKEKDSDNKDSLVWWESALQSVLKRVDSYGDDGFTITILIPLLSAVSPTKGLVCALTRPFVMWSLARHFASKRREEDFLKIIHTQTTNVATASLLRDADEDLFKALHSCTESCDTAPACLAMHPHELWTQLALQVDNTTSSGFVHRMLRVSVPLSDSVMASLVSRNSSNGRQRAVQMLWYKRRHYWHRDNSGVVPPVTSVLALATPVIQATCIVTGHADGSVRVWDPLAAAPRLVTDDVNGAASYHGGAIDTLILHPVGPEVGDDFVASGCRATRTIMLWNPKTWVGLPCSVLPSRAVRNGAVGSEGGEGLSSAAATVSTVRGLRVRASPVSGTLYVFHPVLGPVTNPVPILLPSLMMAGGGGGVGVGASERCMGSLTLPRGAIKWYSNLVVDGVHHVGVVLEQHPTSPEREREDDEGNNDSVHFYEGYVVI